MTRVLPALILALISSAPASAAPLSFFAYLSGAAEAPPVASPGTGTTVVTIDDVANTMRVQVSFRDLVAGVTASHIHGPTALPLIGTAGVATSTPTLPGFPSGVTSGFFDSTFDMTLASSYRAGFITANGGTPGTARAALFSAIEDERAYLNIHTSFAPGGEIRGFLQECGGQNSTACPTVPEPASLTLAGLALAGLILRRRTR